jgi:hypothetical protein
VDQILGQILRQAVWERLDLLDELATHADASSLASVAHTELPRLTGGWRALLAQHEPDSKGNCPTCSSRWRAQKAPCTVWQAAHQHLVAPETDKTSNASARTDHSAAEHSAAEHSAAATPAHNDHYVDPRPGYHSEQPGQHSTHRPGQHSTHHQPAAHHQRPAQRSAPRPARLR